MTIKGIDVSNYQSETYSTSGFDFVFVKATEGVSYVNPKYLAQLKNGRDHGLVVGHYLYVNGNHTMRDQVDYFLSKAQIREGELLALDWEEAAVSSAEKDEALKYLKSKKPGNKVLLYCSSSYWKSRDVSSFCQDGLWIAEYNGKDAPSITHPWVFWQYTSSPIDTSRSHFASRDELKKWAGYPVPKPVYAPFPGAAYFKIGRTSKLISAMGRRIVAEGYKGYRFGPGPVFTKADKAAYAWWQKKLGYTGSAADGIPGKTSWDRLRVPKV